MASAPTAAEIKASLKAFESTFRQEHGRNPVKEDIKSRPVIAAQYRAYAALKVPAASRSNRGSRAEPAPAGSAAGVRQGTPPEGSDGARRMVRQVVPNPFRSPTKSRPPQVSPAARRWLDGPTGTTPTKRGSWQRLARPSMASRPVIGRIPSRSDGVARGSGHADVRNIDEIPVPLSSRAFYSIFDEDVVPEAVPALEPAAPSARATEPSRKRLRRDMSDGPKPSLDADGEQTGPKIVAYRRWTGTSAAATGDGISDEDVYDTVLPRTMASVADEGDEISAVEGAAVDPAFPSDLVALLDLRGDSPARQQRTEEARRQRELWSAVLREPEPEKPTGLTDLADDADLGDDAASSASGKGSEEGWDRPDRAP